MSTALKTLKSQGGGDREAVFPRRDSEVGFTLLGRVISLLFKEPEYVENAREDRAKYKGEAVSTIGGMVTVPEREVSGREVVGSRQQQLVPKDVSM